MADEEGIRSLSPIDQMDMLSTVLEGLAHDDRPENIEYLSNQVGRIANFTGSVDILAVAERADKDEMLGLLRDVLFYNIEQQMNLADS